MTRSPSVLPFLVLSVLLMCWTALPAAAASPVARDDYVVATDRYLEVVEGEERYSILIDVLSNDEDADGDRLEVVVQGASGGSPASWLPAPAGTVEYLGGGLFELTFSQAQIGNANEVTFRYQLEGAASEATVRVAVAGGGLPGVVTARNDVFDEPWACWIEMPVLANDSGLDTIVDFDQPQDGIVEEHPANPNVLVYRSGDGGSFSYTAQSSVTGATASATVSVTAGNQLTKSSYTSAFGAIVMADCFGGTDGTPLAGRTLTYPIRPPRPSWASAGLSLHGETVSLTSALPGGTETRRKAYVPFDPSTSSGSAFELRGTFHVAPGKAEWMALGFTSGAGSVITQSELSLYLDVDTGELTLYGRRNGGALNERLGTADPFANGYPFVANGTNYLRLRYDTAPAVPKVDAWINGVRVFSRVDHADVTAQIENVGYHINYDSHASAPGDVWFDDFEIREGHVNEILLKATEGDPNASVGVTSGSTLELGPLHTGCTSDHSACQPSRELSLYLRNDGTQTLEVSEILLEGPTEWTLLAPATPTVSVLPGGNREIRVRVDALRVGGTSSRLEVTSNDPDIPKLFLYFEANITEAPLADFVHYCDDLVCSFDAASSTGVGLSQSSYAWYVDGSYSGFGPAFTRTFGSSGIHTVALQVTDDTGASHLVSHDIGLPPEAAFTFLCTRGTLTCDFDASFTSGGIASYQYSLGDGRIHPGLDDPGDVLLRHTYATSGRYDVTLTVVDADGQEDSVSHEVVLAPTADFVASCDDATRTCTYDASASTPLMALYEWRFGDGSYGAGPAVTHMYATSGVFPVTLTVVDGAGQVETVTKSVSVSPLAAFTVSCEAEARECTFDGSAYTPGVHYAWNFGDGSPQSTGAVQSHTYATSGIFTVTLTVTDGAGQTASDSRPVTLAPKADFTVSCDGLRCAFDAGGSTPGVVIHTWSFGGGGATASGPEPVHEFSSPGEFLVTLTITDGSAQTASTSKTVTVFDAEGFLLLLLDRR